jgi:hypothetical protein
MNGISVSGDAGPVKISAGWFKWSEGDSSSPVTSGKTHDDADFYMVDAALKASDQLGFGLTAAAIMNNGSTAVNVGTAAKTDEYYLGANADLTLANFGVAGSFLYKQANGDNSLTDGDTFMVNLYAKAALGSAGKIKLHGIFIPSDDSTTGTDRFFANNAGYEIPNDNLMIFATDAPYNNGKQGGLAVYDGAYAGYGLIGLMLSGDYKLPEASYLKYGAGYFMVADDTPDNRAPKNDSVLGAEVAAQVGKKFAEKYDLSLRGAYGFMGDFYKTATTSPDDTYKVVAMLNVSFLLIDKK